MLHVLVFSRLFPSYFFLRSHDARTRRRILAIYKSYDSFPRKGVPVWVALILIPILGVKYPINHFVGVNFDLPVCGLSADGAYLYCMNIHKYRGKDRNIFTSSLVILASAVFELSCRKQTDAQTNRQTDKRR